MDFGTDLAFERYKLSKKAQKVCDDIENYRAYFLAAKKVEPPVIRIEPSQLETVKTSLSRLKVEADSLNFKGVKVVSATADMKKVN
jgi:hypothetical protein